MSLLLAYFQFCEIGLSLSHLRLRERHLGFHDAHAGFERILRLHGDQAFREQLRPARLVRLGIGEFRLTLREGGVGHGQSGLGPQDLLLHLLAFELRKELALLYEIPDIHEQALNSSGDFRDHFDLPTRLKGADQRQPFTHGLFRGDTNLDQRKTAVAEIVRPIAATGATRRTATWLILIRVPHCVRRAGSLGILSSPILKKPKCE